MQAWRVDRESKGGSNVCGHMKAAWWAPMHYASRMSGVKPSNIFSCVLCSSCVASCPVCGQAIPLSECGVPRLAGMRSLEELGVL